MLNAGFFFLGVAATVSIVDRVLSRHEEQMWAPVSTVAKIRLRRFAASIIVSVSTLCLEEVGPGKFADKYWKTRVDPRNRHMDLFQDPDWIMYVRSAVIPASRLAPDKEPEFYGTFVDPLNGYQQRLKEHLSLFPQSANPTLAASVAIILDEIPEAVFLLIAYSNGNPNFATPDMSTIVSQSLAIIEEVNRDPRAKMTPLWTEPEGEQPSNA